MPNNPMGLTPDGSMDQPKGDISKLIDSLLKIQENSDIIKNILSEQNADIKKKAAVSVPKNPTVSNLQSFVNNLGVAVPAGFIMIHNDLIAMGAGGGGGETLESGLGKFLANLDIGEAFISLGTGLGLALVGAGAALAMAFRGLGEGLASALTGLGELAKGIGEGLGSALKGALEGLGALGEGLGRGLGAVLTGLGDLARGIGEGLGSAFKGFLEGLGDFAEGIGKGLGAAFKGFLEGLGDFVEGIGSAIGNVLLSLFSGIGELAKGLGEGIGSALSGLFSGVGELAKGIGEGLGEAIKGALEGLGALGKGIGEGFGSALSGAGDLFKGIGIGFGEALKGGGDALGAIAKGIGDGIADIFRGGGDAIATIIKAIKSNPAIDSLFDDEESNAKVSSNSDIVTLKVKGSKSVLKAYYANLIDELGFKLDEKDVLSGDLDKIKKKGWLGKAADALKNGVSYLGELAGGLLDGIFGGKNSPEDLGLSTSIDFTNAGIKSVVITGQKNVLTAYYSAMETAISNVNVKSGDMISYAKSAMKQAFDAMGSKTAESIQSNTQVIQSSFDDTRVRQAINGLSEIVMSIKTKLTEIGDKEPVVINQPTSGGGPSFDYSEIAE